MAIYQGDLWIDRPAEGFEISPNVRLIETPGHTREDITTVVETQDGVVAFTHLWWSAEGPADDPYTFDRDVLRQQRERVLRSPIASSRATALRSCPVLRRPGSAETVRPGSWSGRTGCPRCHGRCSTAGPGG